MLLVVTFGYFAVTNIQTSELIVCAIKCNANAADQGDPDSILCERQPYANGTIKAECTEAVYQGHLQLIDRMRWTSVVMLVASVLYVGALHAMTTQVIHFMKAGVYEKGAQAQGGAERNMGDMPTLPVRTVPAPGVRRLSLVPLPSQGTMSAPSTSPLSKYAPVMGHA